MTTYAERLAARAKTLCTIYDFPAQNTRFVSRLHGGVSTAGWTYVFLGAQPQTDDGTELDLQEASLTLGAASFSIVDRNAAVTAWLARFDGTLRLAEVIRRQGFVGVAESEYQVSRWQFEDYQVTSKPGGYEFKLANVLKAISQSLYDDFDEETYSLDEATYGSGLPSGSTTITLEKSPKGLWREPGHVVLYERGKKISELVSYVSIGGAGNKNLQTCVRRKFGVGSSAFGHMPGTTDVSQVWVKRGNPLDIMLEWLTTTGTAAANGAHDTGDGDGLGGSVHQSYVDIAGIHAIRDTFWPVPTFSGDAKTSGTAVLFVEKGRIDDLKKWIEDHILRPFGLIPLVGADERFGVDTYYRTPPITTNVDDEWRVRDFRPSQWKRNWDGRQNNLSMLTDWDISIGEYAYQKPKTQPTSIARFGKSKPMDMSGRGHRTGRRGFPDYASATDMEAAATRILLALSNPGTTMTTQVFYKFKDVNLGELVRMNLPGVPDIMRATRGLTGALMMITRRRVAEDKGYVELEVRHRRALLRPAFVAPNAAASTYTAAADADRLFCYLTPNDDGQFADGTPCYTVTP